MTILAMSFALVISFVAAWEIAIRRWSQARVAIGTDYWRVYADADLNQRGDRLRREYRIRSTGVLIHVDVYARPESYAPILIVNHGSGSYGRMFLPAILEFYDRGYTVILPDQRGQGFSGGLRGDHTISEGTQNIVDVARWAHNYFKGPLFLFGVSAGGSLTYYAAASGTPAQAIACVNLLDFGDPAIGEHFTQHPHLISLVMKAIPWLSLIGWLHIPMKLFARSEQQQHEDCQQFQLCWRADPVIPPHLTVRALISYLTTPPPIPFEANEMPVLVLNQGADQIIDPAFTRRNYERLSGKKNYIELEGFGHWSTEHRFWHTIVDACDKWFQTVSLENTLS